MAADVIASRCAVVILGGRNPADVDLNSKIEEASGVMEVLLIPTWANESAIEIKSKMKMKKYLAVGVCLKLFGNLSLFKAGCVFEIFIGMLLEWTKNSKGQLPITSPVYKRRYFL